MSFNGMYFSYGRNGIGSIAAIQFRGTPAVGAFQLVAEVTIMMQPADTSSLAQPPRIVAIQGQLSLAGSVIAPLHLHFVDWRCFPNYSQKNSAPLRAVVSAQQVRAIDDARAADGSLALGVTLVAQLVGPDGPASAELTDQVPVTSSDWSRILKEMKFEDRASFDVPIEGGLVQPPLDKAAAYMRSALDKVQWRQWDDALTKCREVLDELKQFQPAPTPDWPDWADAQKRRSWPLVERLMAAQAALRNATHAGAHASIGTASEQEVRLIVTMTAAILKYYASR